MSHPGKCSLFLPAWETSEPVAHLVAHRLCQRKVPDWKPILFILHNRYEHYSYDQVNKCEGKYR